MGRQRPRPRTRQGPRGRRRWRRRRRRRRSWKRRQPWRRWRARIPRPEASISCRMSSHARCGDDGGALCRSRQAGEPRRRMNALMLPTSSRWRGRERLGEKRTGGKGKRSFDRALLPQTLDHDRGQRRPALACIALRQERGCCQACVVDESNSNGDGNDDDDSRVSHCHMCDCILACMSWTAVCVLRLVSIQFPGVSGNVARPVLSNRTWRLFECRSSTTLATPTCHGMSTS